jgi:hypothetical protein
MKPTPFLHDILILMIVRKVNKKLLLSLSWFQPRDCCCEIAEENARSQFLKLSVFQIKYSLAYAHGGKALPEQSRDSKLIVKLWKCLDPRIIRSDLIETNGFSMTSRPSPALDLRLS